MGKLKKVSRRSEKPISAQVSVEKAVNPSIDPALAALFNASVPRTNPAPLKSEERISKAADQHKDLPGDESELLDNSSSTEDGGGAPVPATFTINGRKRKRAAREDDIEDRYMQKLAQEEEQENADKRRQKRDAILPVAGVDNSDTSVDQTDDSSAEDGSSDLDEAEESNSQAEEADYTIPQHETLAPGTPTSEIEKAARTVFLGNVSTDAIKSKASKRVLLGYLESFFSDMKYPKNQIIESIRFRSTAFSDGSLPKKAAFVKQELMDATTKSTNAYVVYGTAAAAREAVRRLNATTVLGRHLRVDSVAHPSAIDHRRCVFVGNLGFVDDESNIRANEVENAERRPKAKVAADVEEGLWIHFAKAGPVESVRVIRDRNTRVGKGIAYVQFKDPNSVEKALSFNEKKFPPMLPRKLRVTRARKLKKATVNNKVKQNKDSGSQIYKPKPSSQLQSLAGRAGNLLGRAGAHHIKKRVKQGGSAVKPPEQIVFEGHRAVPGSKPKVSKDNKKSKRHPRITKRSRAYRAR